MPVRINRDDVQRMVREGSTLVEVLPENEYAQEHVSGAVNVPLKKLNRQTTAHLEKDQPVIVYCFDRD